MKEEEREREREREFYTHIFMKYSELINVKENFPFYTMYIMNNKDIFHRLTPLADAFHRRIRA